MKKKVLIVLLMAATANAQVFIRCIERRPAQEDWVNTPELEEEKLYLLEQIHVPVKEEEPADALPSPPDKCKDLHVTCQCDNGDAWKWAGAGAVAATLVWGLFWYQRR